MYRLYDQALAEYLLANRNSHADQQAITDALMSLVPLGASGTRDWAVAHPYIRTHLATHAAQGGRIDDLLADPEYLQAAARPQLQAAWTRQARRPHTPPPVPPPHQAADSLISRFVHTGLSGYSRHGTRRRYGTRGDR